MRSSAWLLAVLSAVALTGSASRAQEKENPPQVLPETTVTAPKASTPPPEEPPPPQPPQPPPQPDTNPTTASGRTLPVTNAIGAPQSASQGRINQADIADRPILRPAEVLELIPGLIVTQHSGGGKANQWFLRGFTLDHGTDFATFVDNVPTNLPTHAHGQGYNDLNWLIPELVRTVDFGKGPYYAQVGDFSSVGYASIDYYDALPNGIFKSEVGKNLYLRELAMNSGELGGGTLLYAVEGRYQNNAWSLKEHFRAINGVFRWARGDDNDRVTLSAYTFHDEWNAPNQIPLRAVHEGLIGRTGVIDPTDAGLSSRYTLNASYVHKDDDLGFTTRMNAFLVYYTLDLCSDFTFFLDDPVHGDQIRQLDRRWREGFNISNECEGLIFDDKVRHTIGLQCLNDNIGQVAIQHTTNRMLVNPVTDADVQEFNAGLYYINQIQWLPKVRTIFAARGVWYHFDVNAHDFPVNSGHKDTEMILPKASIAFGPFNKTDFYFNAGYSFHSNDARGVTANVQPTNIADLTPVLAQGVPGLVQARGLEIGMRSQAIPDLTTTAALWYLRLQSELIFAGDAGTTEPNPGSERYGFEWSNTYKLTDYVTLDADWSATHARFLEDAGEAPNVGRHVPEALGAVLNCGPSLKLPNGFYANLRLRYFGPRYLIEDGSKSSRATQLFNLAFGYDRPNFGAGVEVYNLFNSKSHDIDYFYATRLPGEPAEGVSDFNFKAIDPFGMRFFLSYKY